MSGDRQTVAGAYMKIAAHEELCAERYRGINEKLSWVLRSLVGMLLALLAWALVQLYALEPLRPREAHEHTRPVFQPQVARNARFYPLSSEESPLPAFWERTRYTSIRCFLVNTF